MMRYPYCMSAPLHTEITIVRDFVNTVNLEEGPDEIATPAALQRWLADAGLLSGARRLTQADRERAANVREALRDLIGVNNGDALQPDVRAVLDAAATRAELRVRFLADGSTTIEPGATGVDGALGRILSAAHTSMMCGTWHQLKLCGRDSCRWAFSDTSKNHSKRWCSMETCGNRAKGEAFRRRKQEHTHPV